MNIYLIPYLGQDNEAENDQKHDDNEETEFLPFLRHPANQPPFRQPQPPSQRPDIRSHVIQKWRIVSTCSSLRLNLFQHNVSQVVEFTFPWLFNKSVQKIFFSKIIYHSCALKSRGSQLKSVLFLQRSQYISLNFYVVKKPQKARCGS